MSPRKGWGPVTLAERASIMGRVQPGKLARATELAQRVVAAQAAGDDPAAEAPLAELVALVGVRNADYHLGVAEHAAQPPEDRPGATEGPGPGYAATLVLRVPVRRATGWAEADLPTLCARLEDAPDGRVRAAVEEAARLALGLRPADLRTGRLTVRFDLEERRRG